MSVSNFQNILLKSQHGLDVAKFFKVKVTFALVLPLFMVWRSSVRPSVSHIMSAQYLEKFMSDSHGT